MTHERRDEIVIAIATAMPFEKWFSADEAAQLTGLPVGEVIEVLDDEAQTGDLDERRVHDDHTLYKIPQEDE